jgi:hypothetical protein
MMLAEMSEERFVEIRAATRHKLMQFVWSITGISTRFVLP